MQPAADTLWHVLRGGLQTEWTRCGRRRGSRTRPGKKGGHYVFWGREGARAPTFPECSQEEENNLFFELIECEIFIIKASRMYSRTTGTGATFTAGFSRGPCDPG